MPECYNVYKKCMNKSPRILKCDNFDRLRCYADCWHYGAHEEVFSCSMGGMCGRVDKRIKCIECTLFELEIKEIIGEI